MSKNKTEVVWESHPSYGMIGISRVTGSDNSLFGSSIKHGTVIRIRIRPAHYKRDLCNDRHYSKEKSIVEVDLSPTQFAEFITSMNMGEGVPCTIRQLNGQSGPAPKFQSKREQFVDEFKEHTDRVEDKLDDLLGFAQTLKDKASVSKADRQQLLNMINQVRQDIRADLPFVADQFNEQMEKTVHEAKGEFEAFIAQRVQEVGLDNLPTAALKALGAPSTDSE